ncbi:flagellar biosynthesis protein FlhB [Microbulbifer sp. TYP-18]|uniref:flagellar biosynthesis protein FlhB n=1 Tax=Microbulbifer sp. TYP-18 TaxID=3230024 RepID=UPI0034C62E10
MAQGQESSEEKTEPASPFKLREAKKMGQAAKSVEIVSATMLMGFLLALVGMGEELIYRLLDSASGIVSVAGQLNLSKEGLSIWAGQQFLVSISVLVPVLLIAALFAVIGNVVQTGFIFSSYPLKPDFKKLNPVNGLKKIFSLKTLFDLFKTLIKLAILAVFLYFFIKFSIGKWLALSNSDASSAVSGFIGTLVLALVLLIPIMAAIALLDLLFARKSFFKQMRMTKKEVKDEIKRREGDPNIKQRRKELQQELRSRGGGVGNVPSADVIVTNPTHISVALRYDPGTMVAPKVIAKGQDDLAMAIQEAARKHGVKIIRRVKLARELYKSTKLNDYISVELYMPVARLLHEVKRKRRSRNFIAEV